MLRFLGVGAFSDTYTRYSRFTGFGRGGEELDWVGGVGAAYVVWRRRMRDSYSSEKGA